MIVQDPAVQQATANSGGGPSAGLDNYDPFNKHNATSTSAGGGAGGVSQPAVMSPTQEAAPAPGPAPPTYTQSAQQIATAADFQVI